MKSFMKQKANPRYPRKARERGISAIEAIFYLSIAASVIVFTAQLARNESNRQEDVATASTLNLFLSGAQEYVSSEYDRIRERLLQAAIDEGSAELTVPISELANLGYIPPAFTNTQTNLWNQDYSLLLRAVRFQDTNIPQATMRLSEIDSNNDGRIDDDLVDRSPDNDEMTIEAILVSHGGNPVPGNRGSPIVVRTEKPIAGFVTEPGIARGAYGNFVFDITGFEAFDNYPEPGNFASIIALSRFGTVGLDIPGEPTGAGIDDPLRRCVDILALPGQSRNDPAYTACLATNDMFSNIVFNNYDVNGDGMPDLIPGIAGILSLEMGAPVDTNGDGIADRFPRIGGVSDLSFREDPARPGSISGVSNLDFSTLGGGGQISNLARIACESTTGTATAGTLVVNCPFTRFEGDVNIGGGSTVEGTQTAGRFVANEQGGQDLSEGIYDARVLRSQDTIQKPICPATTADGSFAMEPRVYVIPAAYSHPGGLPSVGVRAFAEDISPTEWRVRLFNFVDEDNCVSSVTNPLTLNTGDFRAENNGSCTANDGRADVYEIPGNIGRVLAITRCF